MTSDQAADLGNVTDLDFSVTREQLDAANALYVEFPSFEEWKSTLTDPPFWELRLQRLAEAREGRSDEQLELAKNATMRLAALDTGAIEGLYQVDRGFTYSVAFQATGWEYEMDRRGPEIRPLFEAQLNAYELVLDAATEASPLSEVFIRSLHQAVTEAQISYVVFTPQGRQQRNLPRGVYKSEPNHPWAAEGLRHAYAPVADTPREMHRLVETTRTDRFQMAHPIVQAAYVHYALASIHPFADGNGRLSRAMASVYLYRAASIPLLIFADQKNLYLDALVAADGGDHQRFTDFVFDRAAAAAGRFTEILLASQAPDLSDSLTKLATLNEALPGVTFKDLDSALGRFASSVLEEVKQQIDAHPLPANTRAVNERYADQAPSNRAGFRHGKDPEVAGIHLQLSVSPPASSRLDRRIDFFVTTQRDPRTTFLLLDRESAREYEFSAGDLIPELSDDARYRITAFVDSWLREAFLTLQRNADAALRDQGFQT